MLSSGRSLMSSTLYGSSFINSKASLRGSSKRSSLEFFLMMRLISFSTSLRNSGVKGSSTSKS